MPGHHASGARRRERRAGSSAAAQAELLTGTGAAVAAGVAIASVGLASVLNATMVPHASAHADAPGDSAPIASAAADLARIVSPPAGERAPGSPAVTVHEPEQVSLSDGAGDGAASRSDGPRSGGEGAQAPGQAAGSSGAEGRSPGGDSAGRGSRGSGDGDSRAGRERRVGRDGARDHEEDWEAWSGQWREHGDRWRGRWAHLSDQDWDALWGQGWTGGWGR